MNKSSEKKNKDLKLTREDAEARLIFGLECLWYLYDFELELFIKDACAKMLVVVKGLFDTPH